MLDHLTKFMTIVSEKRGVHHLLKSSAKLRFSIIVKCLFSKTLFFSEFFSSVESCDDFFFFFFGYDHHISSWSSASVSTIRFPVAYKYL